MINAILLYIIIGGIMAVCAAVTLPKRSADLWELAVLAVVFVMGPACLLCGVAIVFLSCIFFIFASVIDWVGESLVGSRWQRLIP